MSDHHKIHYIELPATDMAAMKSFYGGVLDGRLPIMARHIAAFMGLELMADLTPIAARVSRRGKAAWLYFTPMISKRALRR